MYTLLKHIFSKKNLVYNNKEESLIIQLHLKCKKDIKLRAINQEH